MENDTLIQKLKELQQRIHSQDHSWHMTKYPLYMVFRKHEVVTTEDYSSEYTYYDHDNICVIGKDKASLVEEIKERDLKNEIPFDLEIVREEDLYQWIDNYTEHGIQKHYVESVDVYEQVFLTEASANEYIERKKYHNSSLHLYVKSGYDNLEMQVILQLLGTIDLDKLEFKED